MKSENQKSTADVPLPHALPKHVQDTEQGVVVIENQHLGRKVTHKKKTMTRKNTPRSERLHTSK